MTTQTEPLVQGGRVKSMKSKFESLSSLESLDISGALINNVKSKPFAKFQRSATSLDLFAVNKSMGVNNKPIQSIGVRSGSNIRRQSSDAFLSKFDGRTVKGSNGSSSLKEIKENVEQVNRLTRQTSDPVKRSSIRRSPAFRVLEKPIKAVVASIATKTVPEEDVPEKMEKLLKRTVDDKKFLQSGITDTLKAALRQPLPSGPPPKKPPRAFESPKEDINTIQLFEEKLLTEKKNESNDYWREERTGLKSNATKKSSKNHSTSSNLLSCIRCTTPIYDAVVPHNSADTFTVPTKSNPTEHIYMEPFSHLKEYVARKQQCLTAPDIVTSSMPLLSNCEGKSNRSDCSCPEDHNGKGGDLHYLVSFFVVVSYSFFLLLLDYN